MPLLANCLRADETDMAGEEIAMMRDQLHQMLVNSVRAEMRPIMSVEDQIDRGRETSVAVRAGV